MKHGIRFLMVALLALPAAASAQQDPRLRAAPPAEPIVRPQLPATAAADVDRNRIDDRLDREIAELRCALAAATGDARRSEAAARLAEPMRVELVFGEQITQQQIDSFVAAGGRIEHVFQAVSYGWTGTIARASIDAVSAALGESLLIVVPDLPAQMHMDEATRTGRVRPVWASGFANSGSGFSGSANITIGIIDSGVDDSHTDLAGRVEFWKDYTTDNEATPRDIVQHGSHVAGIALGTGAAFGQGPGTLRYTDSGNLAGVAANSFFLSMMHLTEPSMLFSQNATWLGGGSTLLRLATRANGQGGLYSSFSNSATAVSPLQLDTQLAGDPAQAYTSALAQNQQKTLTRWAVASSITNYPGPGDGFNAMRGVAAGARWAGAKVFTNAGTGSSTTIAAAIDDLVAQRVAHNIKVVNMSIGIIGSPGIDATLRAKANTMATNGIVVVCSAGNDGAGSGVANQVDDPGRAALVLTVGASNDVDTLTQYTSSGFASPDATEDLKPDLLAPGGSDFYSYILSVDSNDADAEITTFPDRVANDYYNIKGTSMASPFAAGAAALVIDAMQQSGTPWTFAASQSLFVKMMLCASATETNANREVATGTNPVLGRAAAPKDLFEGYGLINPDAAIEAVSLTWSGEDIGDASAGGRFDRRAWGRRLGITSGFPTTVMLTPDSTADYDIYLYSETPDAKGNPVIRASSTKAGTGIVESFNFTPTANEKRYLFIKRVSGSGGWSLTSFPETPVCGDQTVQSTEDCDDGNTVSGDCCSSTCTAESDGSPCSDGLFCTATDACSGGVCTGSGNPCSGGAECNNSCNESINNCASAAGTPCTSDANPCTLDQCSGAGSCAHPPGNAGSVCRSATGVCDTAETCTGASSGCPTDSLVSSATVCRAAGAICDAAERCTGSGPACPADSFATTATTCRAAATACDAAESCSGTSSVCPADGVRDSSTVCRSAVSACDVAETCTGSDAACPANTFATPDTICRAAGGVCDVDELCPGTSAVCPANAFVPTSSVCRAISGVCDVAESCTGSTADCPAEGFRTSATACRAAAGVCDAIERCTGSAAACPADQQQASSVVCRSSVSPCDAAERCSGIDSDCPGDAAAASGTVCRAAAGACDVAEQCTGSQTSCPADAFAPGDVVCRSAAGICDIAESCPGTSAACPADAVALASVTCRAAQGVCDVAEKCTGTTKTCPADGFSPASTTCRAKAGDCDAAESCTGTSAGCPADAALPTSVLCRSSSGECDAVERCDGITTSCPANLFRIAGAPCASDGKTCTSDVCDGSTAVCQHVAITGACDDGLFCNGPDSCSGGSCSVHAGNPCPGADGDADCSEGCREQGASCDSPDPDGSPCDDGIACTASDSCTGGVCSGDASAGCTTTTIAGPITTTTLEAGLCGDANGDDAITAADALLTLRTAVGTSTCAVDVCDYTGDSKVTATDALAILRRAVGQNIPPQCPAALNAIVSTTLAVTTTLDLR